MAVILFVAAFFIDILLVAFPILLGGVEFTLAVPGITDTPSRWYFSLVVLFCILLMWNFHELVRLIYCAVMSKGKRLKYRFRPMAPVATLRNGIGRKKLSMFTCCCPRSFHRGVFVGMACTGSGAFSGCSCCSSFPACWPAITR